MTIDREALREKVARAIERAFNSDNPFYADSEDWTEWLPEADAALSALDQLAQEPVAWMVTHPEEGKDLLFLPLSEFSKEQGWTETPLYAAPQPATLPDDLSVAISQLRALCNDKIRKINQGRGVKTEGFRDINDLLKACDKVFATLPDESR